MYIEVTESMFIDQFNAIRPDQFSYEALRELFSHYTQYESDTGESIRLDVIAICCEWSELERNDMFYQYGEDYIREPDWEGEEIEDEYIESDMQEVTTCIALDNGNFLVMDF